MCGIFLKYLREPSDLEETRKRLYSIKHRGPDDTRYVVHQNWFLGFTRLAIVGLNEEANQPLSNPHTIVPNYLICNGEIYNHQDLKSISKLESSTLSDCEIIIHLLLQQDIDTVCNSLDGVFAFACIIDNKLHLARDPIGVRPLFYGFDELGRIAVASEAKALVGACDQVKAFPPGSYASLQLDTSNQSIDIRSYLPNTLFNPPILYPDTEQPCKEALTLVRKRLVDAVVKRTMTERPVGMCLSGGLDSSLVAAILAKHTKINFTAFTIGMEGGDSPDVKAAECVADYLGIPLVKVFFTAEEGCGLIEEIIKQLETYDITTVRASIPNYLLCKHIRSREHEKVVYMGEGADEVAQGYQYFKRAPSPDESYQESVRLVKNLYKYDVLRTDRCNASQGLEVRVPFLDKAFIQAIYSLPRKWVGAREGTTKSLLRSAFDPKISGCEPYLPDKILWRQKEAFSDSVGYNWKDNLIKIAEARVKDECLEIASKLYPHCTPTTKEALLYRQEYDRWYKEIENVDKYWMPESDWFEGAITDPSALVLDCYTNSNDK